MLHNIFQFNISTNFISLLVIPVVTSNTIVLLPIIDNITNHLRLKAETDKIIVRYYNERPTLNGLLIT